MAPADSVGRADTSAPTVVEIDGFRCYAPGLALECADYPSEGFDVTAEVETKSFWRRSRNRTLRRIVDELALGAGLSLPFGGSLLVVARKS
jgi:hypothetical protein